MAFAVSPFLVWGYGGGMGLDNFDYRKRVVAVILD
jgi:hypothetical protein